MAKSREARQAVPGTDAAAKAAAQKTEDEEAKRLQEMIVGRPDCFTPTTVAEAQKALGAPAPASSPSRHDYKADAVAVCQDKGRQVFGKAAAYFAPGPVIIGGPQGSFYSYTLIGQTAPEPPGPYTDCECNADLDLNGRVDLRFAER